VLCLGYTPLSPPIDEQTPAWNPCRIPWSPEESLASPQILISLRRTSHDDNDNDDDDDDDDDEEPPRVRRRLEFGEQVVASQESLMPLPPVARVLLTAAQLSPGTTSGHTYDDNDDNDEDDEVFYDNQHSSYMEFARAMEILLEIAEIIRRTVMVMRSSYRRRYY